MNPHQVRRIVQRPKVRSLFNRRNHIIIDQGGFGQLRAAMQDSVADRFNLVQALQDTCLRIDQGIKDHLDRFTVGRHRSFRNLLFAAGRLIDQASVETDTLTQTLRRDLFGIGIDYLVFQRGTAAVNYKYFHLILTPLVLSCSCNFLNGSWLLQGFMSAELTIQIHARHLPSSGLLRLNGCHGDDAYDIIGVAAS